MATQLLLQLQLLLLEERMQKSALQRAAAAVELPGKVSEPQ